MTFNRKFCIMLAVALSCAAAVSCDDDDDDETLPSLNGTVDFTLPEFIFQNTLLRMTPSGISHPEGEDYGWLWKVSPGMTSYDTMKTIGGTSDGTYKYYFEDSLTTYTVTAAAFATGYYTSSTSKYTTAVRSGITGGSISGVEPGSDDWWFTDSRDGEIYLVGDIHGTVWMKENLAYKGYGKGFRNSDVTSHVFGRFYTWEDARYACPEGWRLPTDEDWRQLVAPYSSLPLYNYETWSGVTGNLMVYADFNEYELWEYWPNVKVTNATGFNALPFGYGNLSDNSFDGLYDCAVFWTSEESSGKGLYRYMVCDYPDLYIGAADKSSFGANIRCVKK